MWGCVALLCLVSAPLSGQAAPPIIDSLKRVLAQVAPENQAEKANILNLLASESSRYNPVEALQYAKSAKEAADKSTSIVEQLSAQITMSECLAIAGQYGEGLALSFESLQKARQYNLPIWEAHATASITSIYLFLEDTDSALHYCRRGLQLYKAVKAPKEKIKMLCNIGVCFTRTPFLDSALYYYEQAQTEEIKEGQTPYLLIHNNIGDVYQRLGQYPKAIGLLKKSLGDSPGSQTFHPEAMINIGKCFYKLGRLDSAALYTTKGLAFAEQLNVLPTQYGAYSLLADIAHAQGNDKLAYEMEMKFRTISDSLKGDAAMQAVARAEVHSFMQRKEWENNFLRKQHEADESRIQFNRWMLIIGIIAVILAGLLALTLFRLYRERQNTLLSHRNAQINEYTRLSSHILRARVATMLGLLSLFKPEKLSKDEQLYLEKLKETTDALDTVIHEIHATLSEEA